MTLRELSQLIALGEGQHLEFKQRVPSPERMAKEVIAFANSGGGRLLLGVSDDGEILGVRDAEEEEFALRQALSRHAEPPIRVTTERLPVTRKRSIIVVEIPTSPEKPHFLINGHPKARIAYVRVEDMSVEASHEAVRLMHYKNDSDDVLFEFGENEQALMRYLDNYGRISVDQFATLVNVSPKVASHKLILLTRANVLRLHHDAREDYFTLAYSGAY